MFVNFDERAPVDAARSCPFGIAQIGRSLPQRDHAGQLHLPDPRVRADGDRVLRQPARHRRRPAGRRVLARPLDRGLHGVVPALRPPRGEPAAARARQGRAGALRQAHRRHRVPLPHRLERARWASPTGRTSTSSSTRSSAASRSRTSTRSGRSTWCPYVVEPAAGVDRALLAFLADAYVEEEVRGEKRVVLRFHPELAPVKVAVLPLLKKREEIVRTAHGIRDELAKQWRVRLRRHRPAIGSLYRRAGRGRHALLRHRGRADRGRQRQGRGGRRQGDDPRPRLDGAGRVPIDAELPGGVPRSRCSWRRRGPGRLPISGQRSKLADAQASAAWRAACRSRRPDRSARSPLAAPRGPRRTDSWARCPPGRHGHRAGRNRCPTRRDPPA